MLTHTKRQSGISLIIVLWLLSLLTLLAAAYASNSRFEARMNTTHMRTAELRILAEAGLWRGIYELLLPPTMQMWQQDGHLHMFDFEGHSIEVAIQDESGKIDLNTAAPELLYGLLSVLAVPARERSLLVNTILDCRKYTGSYHAHISMHHNHNQIAYPCDEIPGTFNTVAELRLIMGENTKLYNRISPYLTVHSHQPGINIETAHPMVLLSIPGIRHDAVQSFLNYKGHGNPKNIEMLEHVHPRFVSQGRGEIYTILSFVQAEGINVSLSVIVAVRPHSSTPFTILAWNPYNELSTTVFSEYTTESIPPE